MKILSYSLWYRKRRFLPVARKAATSFAFSLSCLSRSSLFLSALLAAAWNNETISYQCNNKNTEKQLLEVHQSKIFEVHQSKILEVHQSKILEVHQNMASSRQPKINFVIVRQDLRDLD